MERLGLGVDSTLERVPGLVYCSIPGFGRTDARAAIPGWESVVIAAAGGYLLPEGTLQSLPHYSSAPLASVFGGISAATGIAAALIAQERDGVGQHVEVPLFDALFEAIGARGVSFERNAPFLRSFGNGIYVCRDGRRVTFVANWYRHLVWLLEVAGHEDWITEGVADFDRLSSDVGTQNELQNRLVDLFATRSALEWETLARSNGCSIAMLRSTEEWKALPAATGSGALVQVDTPGGRELVPGRAVLFNDVHAPDIRAAEADANESVDLPLRPTSASSDGKPDDRRAPLAGFRVLEAARVFAAPSVGKVLAQLGAEVIKIDTDPTDGTGIMPEPFMHEQLDRGKRTCIVDLREKSGREFLVALLPTCDVVVQNFTLGVGERLGLDSHSVRAVRPEAVTLYLNAFGTTGDWAHFRGFAEVTNVATGFTDHVLGDDLPPSGASPIIDLPRWFATDYAAGMLGAFGVTLGLYRRARLGIGASVSTSLFAATTLAQLPWLTADAGTKGHAIRFIRATDGWICVAGPSETVESLVGEGGCAGIEQAAAKLGLGAHQVLTTTSVMAPDGPADLRRLRIADHTDSYGEVIMPGPVIQFSRTPMTPGPFAEAFGASTVEVRASLAGRSTAK